MKNDQKERVPSLRLTLNEKGETYELDFNRESVQFAERREFVTDDVLKYPQTKVPEFFYYAFRANHKSMSKGQTDKILEQMGGLSPKVLERLMLLYSQAQMSNNLQDDEDLEKNGAVTVEF